MGVAEAFCGHKVTKESHPELRQAGKIVELQAGFGSGEAKIKATLRNKANIVIDLEEARRSINYRQNTSGSWKRDGATANAAYAVGARQQRYMGSGEDRESAYYYAERAYRCYTTR